LAYQHVGIALDSCLRRNDDLFDFSHSLTQWHNDPIPLRSHHLTIPSSIFCHVVRLRGKIGDEQRAGLGLIDIDA